MFQILSAINYCHKIKIILKWNAKSKITDFGTSKLVEKGRVQQKINIVELLYRSRSLEKT